MRIFIEMEWISNISAYGRLRKQIFDANSEGRRVRMNLRKSLTLTNTYSIPASLLLVMDARPVFSPTRSVAHCTQKGAVRRRARFSIDQK
jgi:hypothetical protein